MRVPVGVWACVAGATTAAAILLAPRSAVPPLQSPIDGFAPTHLATQHAVERRIAAFPSTERLAADHTYLTAMPHPAGSARDRELAEWTRDQWRAAGLDTVEIVEHQVLLPYPRDATVEMVAPHRWRATLREHSEDPLAFHAYSASGDVTARVIAAGTGTPADFDGLAARAVDVRGKIVLVRYPAEYSYRGYAVYLAQQHGAAAVLMYSDNADAGIQRGGVGFDFLAPGDPTTPGWPSLARARRVAPADARALPRILSLPISTRDARVILDAMRESAVTLHVRVTNDDTVRPIWTVVGRLNGRTYPDQWIIAGNHRDAWVYGGVDPSSGTTVLMEMARTLGALARSGARPKRTILLASWDAEEYALTSSTEWGEQHERELRDKAVAYLNVDAAVSGSAFAARAVPSLAHAVASAAGVPDSSIETRIGAGSDYAVFLDFIGVPIVDMRFQGPYPVYHSADDTHDWVSRIDPGFLRHAAMTRIWATLAMRLANADLLPLDQVDYARTLRGFLREIEGRWGSRLPLASDAIARFEAAAARRIATAAPALTAADTAALDVINRGLTHVESSLIDPAGLDGRPWYRHQVYAPAFGYQPEVLPGLTEAVQTRDAQRVAAAERRFAAALDRAARVLSDPEQGS